MNTKTTSGLSQSEVIARRKTVGYNELPDHEKKSLPVVAFEVLKEPMIFLLIAVVIVYFLLGDKSEAVILLVSVIVIVGIEVFQNHRTEQALAALRNLASPSCDVIRDGQHMTIPSRELVTGDVVVLAEGGRVPADGKLISAENLQADESLLTGESLPVDKDESAAGKQCLVYSGSMIVKGHGLAEVTSIGSNTEVGKIGTSLGQIVDERTLLEREVGSLVKKIAMFAVAASIILALVYWLTRGDLLHGFLAGLTLSIAILPEEFPVVLTVFMALGAWRLAKSNVLTRKNRTIETLGSATVLCTDKTGTLTENKMQVQRVTDSDGHDVAAGTDIYKATVAYGILASQMNPFDPMEEAFIAASRSWTDDLQEVYRGQKIIKEYPLEPTSLSVVHVWADNEGKQQAVALKGAPETVFTLCKLSEKKTAVLKNEVAAIASEGLRVLAVAKGTPSNDLPKDRSEYDYELLGLVALADPVRQEAAAAVALSRQAGIRVIMITGDYAETARHIGREIGLDSERVVTGEELTAMSPDEQAVTIMNTSIFSRVTPDNKFTIVSVLKNAREVVAMTGDGVNDAPALKNSHIGIAMGKRGTDVAREAADIVLLDDNFASIVEGIRLGRRIFANLQKAMMYILIVHMPIIMLSLLPVFMGWPLVLLPVHIVFLEFIIDPSCTLVFENESEAPDTMNRGPRKLGEALFSKRLLLQSLVLGGALSLAIVAAHAWLMNLGWGEEKTRAVTFLLIALTNVAMIIMISGKRALTEAIYRMVSPMMFVVLLVSVVLVLVYTMPFMQQLFKIAPLSLYESLLSVAYAIAVVVALLPVKRLMRL